MNAYRCIDLTRLCLGGRGFNSLLRNGLYLRVLEWSSIRHKKRIILKQVTSGSSPDPYNLEYRVFLDTDFFFWVNLAADWTLINNLTAVPKLSLFTASLVSLNLFFTAPLGQDKYIILIFIQYVGPNNLEAVWKNNAHKLREKTIFLNCPPT